MQGKVCKTLCCTKSAKTVKHLHGIAQVQEALALGADPNKRGIDGSTALMQVREDIRM